MKVLGAASRTSSPSTRTTTRSANRRARHSEASAHDAVRPVGCGPAAHELEQRSASGTPGAISTSRSDEASGRRRSARPTASRARSSRSSLRHGLGLAMPSSPTGASARIAASRSRSPGEARIRRAPEARAAHRRACSRAAIAARRTRRRGRYPRPGRAPGSAVSRREGHAASQARPSVGTRQPATVSTSASRCAAESDDRDDLRRDQRSTRWRSQPHPRRARRPRATRSCGRVCHALVTNRDESCVAPPHDARVSAPAADRCAERAPPAAVAPKNISSCLRVISLVRVPPERCEVGVWSRIRVVGRPTVIGARTQGVQPRNCWPMTGPWSSPTSRVVNLSLDRARLRRERRSHETLRSTLD